MSAIQRERVVVLQVEGVAEVDRRLEQEADVRVHDALGRAGGARRVDDDQRIVRIQRLCRERRGALRQRRGDVVPASGRGRPAWAPARRWRGSRRRGAPSARPRRRRRRSPSSATGLPRRVVPSAVTSTHGFARPAAASRATRCRSRRTRARRSRRSSRSPGRRRRPRARRHEQRHAVALADAEAPQARREAVDLALQLGEGQRAPLAAVAFVDDRRRAPPARVGGMPVDAAPDDVERAPGNQRGNGAPGRDRRAPGPGCRAAARRGPRPPRARTSRAGRPTRRCSCSSVCEAPALHRRRQAAACDVRLGRAARRRSRACRRCALPSMLSSVLGFRPGPLRRPAPGA